MQAPESLQTEEELRQIARDAAQVRFTGRTSSALSLLSAAVCVSVFRTGQARPLQWSRLRCGVLNSLFTPAAASSQGVVSSSGTDMAPADVQVVAQAEAPAGARDVSSNRTVDSGSSGRQFDMSMEEAVGELLL